MTTALHRAFAPVKRYTPSFIWRPIRSIGTAILTPLSFSLQTGHFRSSLISRAVTKSGDPLPWYTYPMIDLLRRRDFTGRTVLEFGGGQSSLWWAKRADRVVTIEADAWWADQIRSKMPGNVLMKHVPLDEFDAIEPFLSSLDTKFDIIIVDGHRRREATALAFNFIKDGGAIVLDNAAGYGFYDETRHRIDWQRVDFYGYSPGNVTQHCTALLFKGACFLLSPEVQITRN